MLERTVELIPPALSERACVISGVQCSCWVTYQDSGVHVNDWQQDVVDSEGADVRPTLQYTNCVKVSIIRSEPLFVRLP
jgi:hypothetical protein